MRSLLFIAVLCLSIFASCNQDPFTYAEVETDYGVMKIKLYNSTPQHRDNFIKLANEGFYDGLLFHRIVNQFMIQGGDPDSRNASPEQELGMGGPGYQIPAEIGAPHLKGAVAAARTPNPEKKSSGSQFYIVQGRPVDDATLDQTQQRQKIQYNPAQRELYKTLGGTPFLDNDYTVFGEVIEGMEVLDKISSVQTNGERPVEDVVMKVRILN